MKPIVVHCLLLTRGGEGVNQRIHYQYVGVSRTLTLRTCETAVSAQRTIEKQNQSRSQTDSECLAAAIQYMQQILTKSKNALLPWVMHHYLQPRWRRHSC